MPSTHLSLDYHVVFSTKDRRRLILPGWADRLHAFPGGAARTVQGVPGAIGGVSDHVHLLLGLRATHRLADVVREVRQSSSRWVHQELGDRSFGWQDGYGAFTVGPGEMEAVRRYVLTQEEHHRARSFPEEYLALLHQHGVPYDPNYLW